MFSLKESTLVVLNKIFLITCLMILLFERLKIELIQTSKRFKSGFETNYLGNWDLAQGSILNRLYKLRRRKATTNFEYPIEC